MEKDIILIILGLPIAFFIGAFSYQIINLIYLWIKYKLENIKDITISIEKIFALIKYMFGIDESDLKSRKNDKKTNYARQFAAYLLLKQENYLETETIQQLFTLSTK